MLVKFREYNALQCDRMSHSMMCEGCNQQRGLGSGKLFLRVRVKSVNMHR